MKPVMQNIGPLINELIGLLDQEASILATRCEQLESLATAAIQRNGEAMEEALAWIEDSQLRQVSVDGELQSVRAKISDVMAVPTDCLRLAWLAKQLPPPQSEVLSDRRNTIVELTERLQRRHMETTVVITECSRVNGMLLESICPSMRSVTTYSAGGQSSQDRGSGLLNVES